MGTIAISVLVLGAAGVIAALVLYFVARRFHVYENPDIAVIEEMLPGANCGGCGFSGCHAFAVACAEAKTMEGLSCPGMGGDGMEHIAAVVGLGAVKSTPRVAVVGCAGDCTLRPAITNYDGVRTCAIEAACYGGESACIYGCLGCGDCVRACPYDALTIDSASGLPVVDFDRCIGCGKCAGACPHGVMQLAERHPDRPIVWVACRNHDRGPAAMKECQVSCIGCGKCVRACKSEAIEVKDFCASIRPDACIGCGECVEQCPRHSIHITGERTLSTGDNEPTSRQA